MRRKLCAAGGMLAVLALSGCGQTIQGTATAPPERCAVSGYEEVLAVSADCGKTIDIPRLASGYTARPVTLDNHRVIYIIDKKAPNGRIAYPPPAVQSDVHPYKHAIVDSVQRNPEMDFVQIDVSDDCPLEKRYDELFADLGCSPVLPEQHGSQLKIVSLGLQLDAEQAAVVLGQPMVDQIEAHATGSGRTAVYEMSMDKLGEA